MKSLIAGVVVARVVVSMRDLIEEVKEALDSAGCEFDDLTLAEDTRYPVIWEGTVR